MSEYSEELLREAKYLTFLKDKGIQLDQTIVDQQPESTTEVPYFMKWGRDYVPPLQCIDERFNRHYQR